MRKLWNNLGLQARILLALQLVAAPFLIFVFYSAYQQQATERSAYEQRSLALARLIAARLDDKIGDLESLTAAFSAAAIIDDRHVSENNAYLARLRRDAPPFANNIAVWDLHGDNVGSLDPSLQQKSFNVSDRDYFRKALTTTDWVVEAPIESRSNGRYIAQFARAVRDAQGTPIGIVSASAELTNLQSFIEPEGALPADAVLTIINDEGVILARSKDPAKWVGRPVPDLSTFNKNRISPTGVAIRITFDGIKKLVAHATSTHVPWTIYIGVPIETIDGPVRASAARFILFGAALVILASALAFAIARTVTRPLQSLTKSATRFGNGDLAHRSMIEGPPENRRLAEAFNKVASELQQRTERLTHLSEVDELTKLPNRRRFEEGLREAVIRCVDHQEQAALLFLDVDRFKLINDSLGHDQGDQVLKTIAARLRSCTHSDDLVARLGGDEFVVLLRTPSEKAANAVAERIRQKMKEPIFLVDSSLEVSLSIGVAMYAGFPMSPSDFLRSADQALYAAKDRRLVELPAGPDED